MHNPDIADYTCFSARHKTYTRLDYFLFSRNLSMNVESTSILTATLSDHSPIIAHLDVGLKTLKSPRWRFNTTLLQNNDFVSNFKDKLIDFIQQNEESTDDPMFVWMAIKGFIRNFTSTFASNLKKTRNKQINSLEKQCQLLEQNLKRKYSTTTDTNLKLCKSELNDLLHRKAEFIMHRVRQKHYFQGSRPSRLLALKIKQCEARSTIDTIRSPTKGLVVEPKEINDTFKLF